MFLCFEFGIGSILIVFSSKLVNLFPLFLSRAGNKLEILLSLFESFLLFPYFAHLFFFHFLNILICPFLLVVYLALVSLDFAKEVVIL